VALIAICDANILIDFLKAGRDVIDKLSGIYQEVWARCDGDRCGHHSN
jgi:hypothetical protein